MTTVLCRRLTSSQGFRSISQAAGVPEMWHHQHPPVASRSHRASLLVQRLWSQVQEATSRPGREGSSGLQEEKRTEKRGNNERPCALAGELVTNQKCCSFIADEEGAVLSIFIRLEAAHQVPKIDWQNRSHVEQNLKKTYVLNRSQLLQFRQHLLMLKWSTWSSASLKTIIICTWRLCQPVAEVLSILELKTATKP
jgi:hypothetical protein